MNPPSLEGAIATLEDVQLLRQLNELARNTVTAGVIQHFEFVYELATKTLCRHLSQTDLDPDEARAATFRDLLRLGGETGLIEDVKAWFENRRLRDLASHAYDRPKRMKYSPALAPSSWTPSPC